MTSCIDGTCSNGANSYTGSTILSGGTLSVGSIANGLISSGIGASSNAAANLVLNGGTLKYTGATLIAGVDRLFTIGAAGGTNAGTLDASGRGLLYFNNAGSIAFGNAGTASSLTLDGIGVGQLAPILGDNGAGATSLTKNGVGTWTLSGAANTYTGTTTINAGTLTVNSGSSIGATGSKLAITGGTLNLNASQSVASLTGTAGALNLGAGTTFTDTSATTQAFASTLGGSGTFTLNNNSGNLTLSGTNTNFQGAVNVQAGTLIAGGTNALGTGIAGTTVTSGAALGFANGVLVNGGTVTVSGTGVSSSGALFNADGNTNKLNSNIALAGATTITANGGTLQIGANNPALAMGFSASGHTQPDEFGTITLGANNNLTFAGTSGNITVYNRIQDFAGQSAVNTAAYGSAGSVTINMTSGGTVTYGANANTYTGTTTINQGKLVVATYDNGVAPHDPVTDSFHGINGAVIVGNVGGTGTATLQIGAKEVMAIGTTVSLFNNGTFDLNSLSQTIDTLTFNHGGTVGFGSASGKLYLNNDVTFTASAGETATIGSAAIKGTLSLELPRNGTVDVLPTPMRTFTVTGDNTSNLTINALIQSGSIVKAGTGMLTLGTNSQSDFTGEVLVNAGVLKVQTGTTGTQSSLGDSNGTNGQGTTVASGATLQIDGGKSITAERLNISGTGYTNGTNGTTAQNAANTYNVGNTGALVSTNGNNVWGGNLTYTNLINLTGDARIQTGNTTATSNLTIATIVTSDNNNKALTIGTALGSTTTVSGSINTGSGSTTTLTSDGYGTLVLSGASSYQGATNITQGIVSLQHASGLGATTSGANGTFVTSGAQLQLSGGITVLNEGLQLNGLGYDNGTVNDGTGALRNKAGTNSFGGAITLGSNSGMSADTGTTMTLSGGITNAAGTHYDLNVGGAGNITLSGAITTGTAPTTVQHDNNNQYTYNVVTSNGTGGTLTKNGTGTLTLSSGVATNTLDGITMTLGNITVSGSTIVRSGPISSANSANVLTISSSSDNVTGYYGSSSITAANTFTGQLAGSGTFQKDGTGTLLFNTSFTATNLTLLITGGEVDLANGINITVGTLHLAGPTGTQITLDFGNNTGLSTVLSATNVIVDSGVQITVKNWSSEVDFWYATGAFYTPAAGTNVAAVSNAQGAAPENTITFQGYSAFTAANTTWIGGTWGGYTNNEIRPIPEPATYGAIFFSGCLALLGWRRLRRRDCGARTRRCSRAKRGNI